MVLKTGKTRALFTIAAASVAALMMYGCSQHEPPAPDPAPQQRQQPAAQARPTQYATIDEAVEALGDFPIETGQFELISDAPQPLLILLSPLVVDGDTDDMVRDEALRAVVYGVYRTFIHTSAAQVTVIGAPRLLGADGKPGEFLEAHAYTAKATREEALAAARDVLGVQSFGELVGRSVGGTVMPDSFTDKYTGAVDDPARLGELAKRLGIATISVKKQ